MKRAVLLLAVLLVAGCATPTPPPTSPPVSVGTPVPSASPFPSPSEVPPMKPSTRPDKGEITVTGTVEKGVEKGCTLLRAGGEVYLLLGGDHTVIGEGARLTVRGRPDPSLLSTCQQGIPFYVLDARPA